MDCMMALIGLAVRLLFNTVGLCAQAGLLLPAISRQGTNNAIALIGMLISYSRPGV